MAGLLLLAALLLDAAGVVDALTHQPGAPSQQHKVKHTGKSGNVKAAARQNPELTEALKQPRMLFDSMSSRMSEFQQGLMAARTESEAAIMKQSELYEQKLKEQQTRNKAAAMFNQKLDAHIKSLTDENTHLSNRADELESSSREVKVELEELRENLTLARDYADRSLNNSHVSFHAAAMDILAELDQEDINASESQLHADRLDEIASAGMQEGAGLRKVAMIQLDAGGQKAKAAGDAEDLMQTLLASWDGVSNEQNASEASLKESFDKEFQEGEDKSAVLLQSQTQLNATLVDRVALNQKLTVAVAYLQKTHSHLLEQKASLKQFARRLSYLSIPKPELHEQTQGNMLALRANGATVSKTAPKTKRHPSRKLASKKQ